MGSETAFNPKVTHMAIVVEAPSINAINRGPASLQRRSIRRIRALSSGGRDWLASLLTSTERSLSDDRGIVQYRPTLQTRLVSVGYDNSLHTGVLVTRFGNVGETYPVAFHGYKVHDRRCLFNARQEDQYAEDGPVGANCK